MSALPVAGIVTKATDAVTHETSVHMVGRGVRNGQQFTWDMHLVNDGVSGGTIHLGPSKINVITSGKTAYIQAYQAYWAALSNDTIAKALGEKWLKTTTDDSTFQSFAALASYDASVRALVHDASTASKGGVEPVGDRSAVSLVTLAGSLWLATTGTPVPVKATATASGDVVVFDQWGQKVSLPVPTDADTVDLSMLTPTSSP